MRDDKDQIGGGVPEEAGLLDYLLIILKRKRMVAGITLAAAAVTAVISLIMTPVYRAETRILPPQASDSGMASRLLSQFSGGIVGAVGGSMGLDTSGGLYVAMLRSRTVLDRMVERFDLMSEYGKDLRVDARTSLLGALSTEIDKKSGLVTIGVMDKDPEKAAVMANAFVEELQALNRDLAVTDASRRRVFLEDQLRDAKDSLVAAEEDLRSFQERTGAIKIDEQASAVLTGIANLRAQVAAREVELRVMRTYATPQNPMLRKAEEEIRGLKEQLAKLESKGTGHNPDPLVPTNRIPELGTEHLRKLREFKYREALYDILLKQYEMARLEEARDPAVIQVVDRAVPPEVRVSPKRRHMVKVAGAAALFFSVLLAFLFEYVRHLRSSAEGEKLDLLKRHLFFWR